MFEFWHYRSKGCNPYIVGSDAFNYECSAMVMEVNTLWDEDKASMWGTRNPITHRGFQGLMVWWRAAPVCNKWLAKVVCCTLSWIDGGSRWVVEEEDPDMDISWFGPVLQDISHLSVIVPQSLIPMNMNITCTICTSQPVTGKVLLTVRRPAGIRASVFQYHPNTIVY